MKGTTFNVYKLAVAFSVQSALISNILIIFHEISIFFFFSFEINTSPSFIINNMIYVIGIIEFYSK